MSIRKYLFRILLLSSIVYSMSCNDENMNVEGMLVYTNGGSSLDSIALSVESDKSLSLYKSKEMVAINNITNVNGEVILFGECAVTGECFVKQYSFETRQDVLLRSGRLPSYISNHHKLFFYDKASDGYNWLFVTSLKNINDATKIAKEPEWKPLPNGISHPVTIAVIQISSDKIIFIGNDDQLWLYNLANASMTATDVKNCRPILWRDANDQLLCSDWDTWDTFLLDINTKSKVSMPELKGAYGFVYLPKSDELIYGRTRSSYLIGEAYDIFLYSFSDKKEKKVKENSHIAGGVWIEGKP